MVKVPTIAEFEEQLERLSGRIHVTPVLDWDTPLKRKLLGDSIWPVMKLELFQRSGTFKMRGALTVIDHMTDEQKSNGVVAGTGGNHGVAVAKAAKEADVNTKIIFPKTINPFRRAAIEALGAEMVEVDTINGILDKMNEIAKVENRTVMHPFENPYVTLGTGTLGLEFMRQVPDMDVVIVPIGGGGLASGVAAAVKQINPACKVYGVEPEGANSMRLSLDAGKPVFIEGGPKSIADSLSSPKAEPYSFAVCQEYLDDVVLVSDAALKNSMQVLFEDMKLGTEPAGAAATAGLLGPLKERCAGARVGVIVCGSNIDRKTFCELLA